MSKLNISNISGTTEQVFTVNGNAVVTATDTALIDEHIGITAGDPHGFIAYLGYTPEPADSDIQYHIGLTIGNPHFVTYSDTGAAPDVHTHGGLIHDNRADLDLVSGTNTGDETQTTILNKLGVVSETSSGYLTSEGYVAFLGKQDDLGFTPVPDTRTINGYDLTANRNLTYSDTNSEPANSNIQNHIGITSGDPHGYTGGDIAALRIGDITSGHYSEFQIDGSLLFIGGASVFEDLNFDPDSSGGSANTLPDYVLINSCVYREFTSANNQLCGSCKELPHSYKLSSVLYPHLHLFLKSGESAGTTGVEFTIYWELRQAAGVTNGSTVLSATSAQLGLSPYKLTINDAIGFAGANELGAQLALTLKRTGGNAGDVIVTTYGVHYEIDTVGSREITEK